MGIMKYTKDKKVEIVKPTLYSELECDRCGYVEDFEGIITNENIPNNWSLLSMESLGSNLNVLDWLLCEKCAIDIIDNYVFRKCKK